MATRIEKFEAQVMGDVRPYIIKWLQQTCVAEEPYEVIADKFCETILLMGAGLHHLTQLDCMEEHLAKQIEENQRVLDKIRNEEVGCDASADASQTEEV